MVPVFHQHAPSSVDSPSLFEGPPSRYLREDDFSIARCVTCLYYEY